jgi:hypothetical protein
MHPSNLSRAEAIAVLGGLLLALGVFLGWYHIENPRNAINGIQGSPHGGTTVSGWQAEPIIRWLLLAAAAAPLILAYIIMRGHALSWPRGEMTAVVAITAFGLVAYVTLISRPGTVRSLTSLEYGAFVALLGTLVMAAGAAFRASTAERPRKPPGVL